MKPGFKMPVPDFSRESYPYYFYARVGLIYNPMPLTFTLDQGADYLIQRINATWSSQNSLVAGYAAPLKIAVVKDAGTKKLQKVPFDIALMSSPAESGVFVATAPGSNPQYPHTAVPLKRSKAINSLFHFRDTIQIEISNISNITVPGDPTGSLPPFLEIMIIGRYFPATYQEGWGS